MTKTDQPEPRSGARRSPASNGPAPVVQEEAADGALSLRERFTQWLLFEGPCWSVSMIIHLVLFLGLALCFERIARNKLFTDARAFDAAQVEQTEAEPEIERFELGDPQLDPSELSTESLAMNKFDPVPQEAEYNDESPDFEKKGGGKPKVDPEAMDLGGAGMNIQSTGLGPTLQGAGGVGEGVGTGDNPGMGGSGIGFGNRGAGKRNAIAGGGTKQTERAVAAAINWLARHQLPDGSWSLVMDSRRCKDRTCIGEGLEGVPAGATALGLLPFLAAGQTHQSKGPYQRNIDKAITWLIKNQKQTGDLSSSGRHQMYEHGLATIALCEAYGMTGDSRIGMAAQAAIKFTETGQNADGAWRYTHGTPDSDTSVTGWQIMSLKSGLMAGLQVDKSIMQRTRAYLRQVSTGNYNGKFGYQIQRPPTPTMTAVGLLCQMYLGAQRGSPEIQEGVDYLMEPENLPKKEESNIYYWYYATLMLHNLPGETWDRWNRQQRRVLVEMQRRGGCAEGSWDPNDDQWGRYGGRLMTTSLACLSLEVYYRYLPLYKLDSKDDKEKTEKKAPVSDTPEPSKLVPSKPEPSKPESSKPEPSKGDKSGEP